MPRLSSIPHLASDRPLPAKTNGLVGVSTAPLVPREILDTEEAATYLRLSVRTLEDMRHRKTGPPFARLGMTRIVYMIDDLREWVRSQRQIVA